MNRAVISVSTFNVYTIVKAPIIVKFKHLHRQNRLNRHPSQTVNPSFNPRLIRIIFYKTKTTCDKLQHVTIMNLTKFQIMKPQLIELTVKYHNLGVFFRYNKLITVVSVLHHTL